MSFVRILLLAVSLCAFATNFGPFDLAYLISDESGPKTDISIENMAKNADGRTSDRVDVLKAKSPQPLAFVTFPGEQQILPIDLEQGLDGRNIAVDFVPTVIATSMDSKTLFVVDRDTDRLFKIDAMTGKTSQINVPIGALKHLAVTTSGKKAFSCYENDKTIWSINLEGGNHSPVIKLKNFPDSFVLDAAETCLYVTSKDALQMYCIDLRTKEIDATLDLETIPEALMLSCDGEKLYLLESAAKNLTTVDIASKAVSKHACGNSPFHENSHERLKFSVNARENALYFSEQIAHEIYKLDLNSHTIETVVTMRPAAESIDFCKDSPLSASVDVSAVSGHTVSFDATATHSISDAKLDYFWEFGDGLEQFTEEPSTDHIYEQSGEYIAGVTVAQTITVPMLRMDGDKSEKSKRLFSKSSVNVRVRDDAAFARADEVYTKAPTLATNTTLSSSLNPSNFGQSVLFTAMVVPQIANPTAVTGTVTFMDGVTALGTTSIVGATATLSTSALSIAGHSITAVYNGDLNYVTSTSSAVAQVVNIATTSSVVTSSANPSTFQQSVTLTATLSITAGAGTPTGTFTFMEGSTNLGTVTISAMQATITLSNLSVATHPIVATYSGDASFQTSISPTFNQVVNQATTTSSLTSSPSASVFGQSVLLTTTVTPANAGSVIPTGTVTFRDGGTALGTSPLVSGVATLSTTALSVATHSLTATYNGDSNFITSTSNAVSQVVTKAATSTALTSFENPTIFGNSTLLTATLTVTSGSGTPTGTITFKNGTTTIGTGTVSGNIATLSISNLSVGVNSLTATYNGDASFLISVSSAVNQTVNPGTTQSVLISSVPTTTYGQSTTFTATVSVFTGTGTPTGYFTFMDGSTTLGTVNLTGLSASLSLANLSVGTHPITAVYSGDTNFQSSTSTPAISQVVNKATPIITLVSAPTSSNYGDTVLLTSTVTAPTSLGLPDGTISFFDGATLLGTMPLVATGANTSSASLSITTLSGGVHSLSAVYSGDINFVTVTSTPSISFTVSPLSTTTTLFINSADATVFGQPVILIANVMGSTSAPPLAPTGTVTFYDGATVIGTSSLSNLSANTSSATLTNSSFTVGPHVFSAVYNANTNYNGSTAPNVTHQVIKSSTSSAVSTSQAPAVYKQTVTFTSSVTPNTPGAGNPSGTVNFYDGTTLLGSGTLTNAGVNLSQATFSTSALELGNHFIYSTYVSDGNFTSSISSAITQVIVMAATTTTFSSSLPTSNFGDLVTWSSTVTTTAPGGGIPTGIVTFYNGSTIMGIGTLNGSGVATYSSLALYPGTYALKAVYGGDTNYTTSTSANFTQTVLNQLATVSTVSSARNPSPVGTAVTYSARITAITGIPTGTVSFYDNGVLIGTGTINASGVASVTQPGSSLLAAPSTHPITAIYSGDANFITSTSAIFNEYIVPYDTTTVLTSSPNHSEQANAVFTATVTPTGLPTPIPVLGGTVTFYDGSVAISTALPVPPLGVVTFQPDNLRFNGRAITAVYSGTQLVFAMSTSNTINQQVQQTDMLTTNIVVGTAQSTTYFCQPVTFSATVTNTQGYYTPTGTVTFYDGTSSLGSAILNSSGVATLTRSTLSIGTHSISATYNSDSNYAYSISGSVQQTVINNPTTTTLSFIPNLSATPYGQNLIAVAMCKRHMAFLKGMLSSQITMWRLPQSI